MSTEQIEELLSGYLGIPGDSIDKYFYKNKIIAPNQSISETILKDANTLKEINVDRMKLTSKFIATLSLYDIKDLKTHLKNVHDYPDYPNGRDQEQMLKDLIKDCEDNFRLEFGLDINNLPKDFPLRTIIISTCGHHQDVFHPSHALSTYYLESDRVGGSRDCVIINNNLVSKEHKEQISNWTDQDIINLLMERLNAPEKA